MIASILGGIAAAPRERAVLRFGATPSCSCASLHSGGPASERAILAREF